MSFVGAEASVKLAVKDACNLMAAGCRDSAEWTPLCSKESSGLWSPFTQLDFYRSYLVYLFIYLFVFFIFTGQLNVSPRALSTDGL